MNEQIYEQKMLYSYFKDEPELVIKLNKLNIYTMSELMDKLESIPQISKIEMSKIKANVKKYESSIKSLTEGMNKLAGILTQEQYSDKVANLSSSLCEFQENVIDKVMGPLKQATNSLFDMLKEPLKRFNEVIVELYKSLPVNRAISELLKDYNNTMINQKWIPILLDEVSLKFITDVAKTEKEDVEFDEFIFSYFDKNYIESFEHKVEKSSLNNEVKNFLINEMLFCYRNEKFNVCVLANTPVWDSIVYKGDYRIMKRFIEKFNEIVPSTAKNKEAIRDFAKNYIYNVCKTVDKVNPDVPGRHSAVHGFIFEFSKKAALSAIFFTDFLISYCLE